MNPFFEGDLWSHGVSENGKRWWVFSDADPDGNSAIVWESASGVTTMVLIPEWVLFGLSR
jgi:hypothetical protein